MPKQSDSNTKVKQKPNKIVVVEEKRNVFIIANQDSQMCFLFLLGEKIRRVKNLIEIVIHQRFRPHTFCTINLLTLFTGYEKKTLYACDFKIYQHHFNAINLHFLPIRLQFKFDSCSTRITRTTHTT